MPPVSTVLSQTIAARGWPTEPQPDGTHRMPVEGASGRWVTYLRPDDEAEQLTVFGIFPGEVPPHQRTSMALLLTRVNRGLIVGCFELDLDDGELRFRCGLDVEGGELTEPLVAQLVGLNGRTLDAYFPAIDALLRHDLAPEEALRLAEG